MSKFQSITFFAQKNLTALALPFFLAVCIFQTMAQQPSWTVERLSDSINTPYDEITPVLTRDGRTLYFTRVGHPDFERTLIFDTINYAQKLKERDYLQMLGRLYGELGQTVLGEPWRSKFNQDTWCAYSNEDGTFTEAIHPGYPLNNALPNSLVAITPDPNAFYIINQFKPEGDMKKGFSVIRKQGDDDWAFPRPVEIKDYYTITSDVNLTMSFDGKVLILSAARFDSRDLDLYICFKEGEHRWSTPQHLGNIINSARREMTPYLSENNRTLYFASDRGESGGGLDIFMTRRESDSWFDWSKPVQLIEPINSKSDESQPYFNMTTGYLYFTSKRAGSSDIYRVDIAPPQATELVIKGYSYNSKTNFQLRDVRIAYQFEGQDPDTILSTDGSFTLKIPKGVRVELWPIKPGFNGQKKEVLFRQDYYYFQDWYAADLFLDPLEVGDNIQLRPVYFQQSKATILEESYPELDYLVDLLRKFPTMHLLISGHTDNNGRPEDLLQLSLDRANAVKEYLVAKEISAQRIQTIGHGPTKPINDNSTDEMRQANRRVEATITKM
jgi:outer membrane protein OmpA-like peptidoglycan-associated protein